MGPLEGLRVIDLATVVAGPGCARYLGDFGAEVIKVERPGGDTTRAMGWTDPADGVTLWWKLLGRNKRTITLDLKDPADLAVMRRLVAGADVLVENFRPGTLERLGLAPEDLLAENPALVITRVSGFGQYGPYAQRPGFATLAEAMSGFAAVNGEPDGAPLLPPIALTDEVTALAAAFATMVALHSGVGQVVDVNLIESLSQIMGPLQSLWATRGELQPRLGSGIPYTVPRGTYRCADGGWVAISTSANSVALRVMDLIGRGDDPRFATFSGRVEHRAEVDAAVADWCAARPLDEVLRAFEEAHAAAAPVYSMADLAADPHVVERGVFPEVDGVSMQGLIARLSETPGSVRWAGRPENADGDAIRAEVDPRARVLDRIADHIEDRRADRPVRVAIDGITGVGKTTFADDLARVLRERGHSVLAVTMDGFHNPRSVRHRQGRGSADGYYEDAYDFSGVVRELLRPLGPDGGRRIRRAIIDLASDEPIDSEPEEVPADTIVVVDGSFLQKEQLRPHWDHVVFLRASFEAAEERGAARDAAALGGLDVAVRAFRDRYHAAQRRYLAECDPEAGADDVVDHEDPRTPTLLR